MELFPTTLLQNLTKSEADQTALTAEEHRQIKDGLSKTLMDWKALAKHIRRLQLFFLAARDKGELQVWPYEEPLPEDVENLLLHKGPGALEDLDGRTLSHLALNYNALLELHEKIVTRLPDAWWDPLVKAGAEAMERDGVTMPALGLGSTPAPAEQEHADNPHPSLSHQVTPFMQAVNKVRLYFQSLKGPRLYLGGAALAASILLGVGLGFFIANRYHLGGGKEILVASATLTYGPPRGKEPTIRVEMESKLPGFATIIALAPEHRSETFPGPGGDDIEVKAQVAKDFGPLPNWTTRVLFVVTETPAAEPIRRALHDKAFTSDQLHELQTFLSSTLEAKGYRRLAFGNATFTKPTTE